MVALLLPGSARADVADAVFRNGLTAFNEASYARAQEAWTPLAEAGDARAQTGLGFMYYSGRGVPDAARERPNSFSALPSRANPRHSFFSRKCISNQTACR
jgi:TPR repeat protein